MTTDYGTRGCQTLSKELGTCPAGCATQVHGCTRSSKALSRLFSRRQPSWQHNQQQHPACTSYHAYFATARLRVDVVCWALTMTLLALLSSTRTLQCLCTCAGITSTTGCSGAALASCPVGSGALPASIWLPGAPFTTVPGSYPAIAAAATASAARQVHFPCSPSFVTNAAWAARNLPVVALQLHVQNSSYEQPVRWALCFLALTIMLVSPTWYVRRGRTPLVAAAFIMPRVLSTVALLGGASRVPLVLRLYLVSVWAGGVKASAVMVYQVLVLPLPGAAQPLTAGAWLLINVVNEALLQGPAASPTGILSYALSTLLVGCLLPWGLHLLYERSLLSQYLAARAAAARGAPAAGTQEAAAAAMDAPAAAAAAAPTAAVVGAPPAVALMAAAEAGGTLAGRQPSTSAPAAGAAAAEGSAPPPNTFDLASAANSAPSRRTYRHYHGVTVTCRVGVKVHHHDAYEQRDAIKARLEATLASSCFAAAAPPFPQQPQQQQAGMGSSSSGSGSVHANGLCAARRLLYRPLGLSTVAIRGCLQLLVTAHMLRDATGAGGHAAAGGTVAASAGAGGAEGSSGDGSQVQGSCMQAHANLAELEQVVQQQVADLYGAVDCTVTVGTVSGSTCSTATGGQVTEAGAAAVQLLPMCVEAGAAGPQEVVVEVAGLPAWVGERDGVGAEAVLCFAQRGEHVVLRGALAFGAGDMGGSCSGGHCRLQLPPRLDAAHMELHLLATGAGCAGVLLGYATTMALPPRAARELLSDAAHQRFDGDTQAHTSCIRLLADMASTSSLLHPSGGPPELQELNDAVAHVALDNMVDYCSDAGLAAVLQFLEQLAAGQAAGAQALPDPQPAGSGAAVAPGGADPHHTPPGMPGPSTAPTDVMHGSIALLPRLAAPAARGWQATSARDAATPEPRGASQGEANSVALASIAAAQSGGTSRGEVPRSWAPGAPPMGAQASANDAPEQGADAVAAATADGGAWLERYTAWKLQHGRRGDLLAALSMLLLWATFLGKEAWHAGGAPHALHDQAAFAAVDIVCTSLPWLALALGTDALRARRSRVMALQSTLYGAKCLLVAAGWVPQPQQFRDGDSTLFVLATLALYFPAMQRVHWQQQLLCNFFLQELPRYIMNASAASCAEGVHVVVPASLLHATVVPMVAAAVAWAVERSSRAEYTRVEARCAAARRKLKGE